MWIYPASCIRVTRAPRRPSKSLRFVAASFNNSRDAVKKLRGPKGSKVNITVKRPGSDEPLPFTITRDIIKIESVPYAFMLDEDAGVGYVRISNFARTTRSELEDKLSQLEREGMESLILDLRFNQLYRRDEATAPGAEIVEEGNLELLTNPQAARIDRAD